MSRVELGRSKDGIIVEPWEPTIEELLTYLDVHDIPLTARLRYAGCGTHAIAVEWEEEEK